MIATVCLFFAFLLSMVGDALDTAAGMRFERGDRAGGRTLSLIAAIPTGLVIGLAFIGGRFA